MLILVTFDTTRADHLGLYGYNTGLTKGFDDFASQGVTTLIELMRQLH